MHKLILLTSLLMLSPIITDTSFATIIAGGDDCANHCHWSLDAEGKLILTGSGNMDDYLNTSKNRPWDNYRDKIKSVDIQGLNNVGNGAFCYFNKITSVNIGDTVNNIKDRAFQGTALTSLTIPETLTQIGTDSFRTNTQKEIIISAESNMEEWSWDAFNDQDNPIETFRCLGDVAICQNKLKKFMAVSAGGTCSGSTGCMLRANITAATESQCNNSKSYYFTGSECIKRPTDGADITCEHEISGYVKVGNYCASPENTYAKKHYTPAEANQWLHDGNDNFVVITFKK